MTSITSVYLQIGVKCWGKKRKKKTRTFVIVGQLVQKRFFRHFARGVVQRVGHLCKATCWVWWKQC